jgi:2-polyprenyl-3-methyl-5-hydroxy-6-metoxy-1,4-benzoquinol methylase
MTNGIPEAEIKRICPICGQDDYIDWYHPPQSPGPVVQCKGCGFVYVSPIQSTQGLIQEGPVLGDRPVRLLESSNLEDVKGSWEEPIIINHMKELDAKKANAHDALHHIHSLVSQHGKLLDIGCFCGIFLGTAAEAGWDCYGIEPLVMPAVHARARFGLKVTTDTLRENTYPAGFFDVITAFQVFEHIIHPEKELEKIDNILKPGGLLLVEVPTIDTFTVKLLGTRHRHFVQDHVSFFSAETLSNLLRRKGFQVRKVYYPTRALSVQHIVWWVGRYSQALSKSIVSLMPAGLLNKPIHINLKDIVAIIAEKN